MFLIIQKKETLLVDMSHLNECAINAIIEMCNTIMEEKIIVLAKVKEVISNNLESLTTIQLLPSQKQIDDWLTSELPENLAKVHTLAIFQKILGDDFPQINSLNTDTTRQPLVEVTFDEEAPLVEQDTKKEPTKIEKVSARVLNLEFLKNLLNAKSDLEDSVSQLKWDISDPRETFSNKKNPFELLLKKKGETEEEIFIATIDPEKKAIVLTDEETRGLGPSTAWDHRIYAWCLPQQDQMTN